MSHRPPVPHEKGPAARGLVAGRPSSRGGLSRCGQQVARRSSNSGSRRSSPAPRADGGELPEWGSAAPSYGRECMTSAPRQHAGGTAPSDSDSRGNPSGAGRAQVVSSSRSTAEHRAGVSNHGSPSQGRQGASSQGRQSPSEDLQRYVSFDDAQSLHCFEATDRSAPAAAAADSCPSRGGADYDKVGISQWSAGMVHRWLTQMGLGSVAGRFAQEALDGEALLECREDDFVALGVERLGDRKKLMKQIRLRQAHEADAGSWAPPASRPQGVSPGMGNDPSLRQWGMSDAGSDDIAGSSVGSQSYRASSNSPSPPGKGGGRRERGPPDASSNEPSSDNPLLRTNRRAPRSDRDTPSSRPGMDMGGKGAGGQDMGGKGDGKGGNSTSASHPLAVGSRWGEVRGLPERPIVQGEIKARTTWTDDPGPSGRAM